MSYEMEGRVRYTEIDPDQDLTVTGIINYLQDCACFHDLDSGFGVDFWGERKSAWVLTAWNIIIGKNPRYGERIKVRTDCYKLRTFLGFRNFRIFNEKGEVLVAADSRWALMNMEKGRPVSALKIIGDAYGKGEELPVEWEGKHIVLPCGQAETYEPIKITREYLDTNDHVNNGKYVEIALRYLPQKDINSPDVSSEGKGSEMIPSGVTDIRKLWIEYNSQAREGDIIIPKVIVCGNGSGSSYDGNGGSGSSDVICCSGSPDVTCCSGSPVENGGTSYIVSLENESGDSYCVIKTYDRLSESDKMIFDGPEYADPRPLGEA